MKITRLLLFVVFIFSQNLNFAQSDTLSVKSVIKDATVFSNAAQIFRTGKVNVPRGKTILAFRGIARGINGESIQVNTKNSVTILSVNHGLHYTGKKAEPAALKAIQDKKEIKNIEIRRKKAEFQVYQQEEKLLLAHLNSRGNDKEVNASQMRETAAYLRGQLSEVKQKMIDISLETVQVEAELADLTKEAQNLQKGTKGEYETKIFVAVEAKSPTAADFTISYLQSGAGWSPNYDVRVADVNEPVNLTYKASVFQSTGEDWKNVNLTLSTGEPTRNGNKPNLNPWRLSFNNYRAPRTGANRQKNANPARGNYRGNQVSGYIYDEGTGEGLIGASVLLEGTSYGTVTDVDGRYVLNLPQGNGGRLVISYIGYDNTIVSLNSATINAYMGSSSAVLDEVVVLGYGSKRRSKSIQSTKDEKKAFLPAPIPTNQTEEATSIEFNIEIPYSVPSDGKKYSVAVASYTLPAGFEYFTAPKVEQAAYLTAKVTDWGKYNLLTGEMNLFFGGTYLGKSVLNVSGTTDTLTLSLGKDKNVLVKRKRDEKYTDRQFIGNKKTVEIGWNIEVRNKKSKAIKVRVEDQYPLSTNDDIEVKLVAAKKADKNEKTGKLTWELELPPNTTEELSLRYTVKYPKSRQLVLE